MDKKTFQRGQTLLELVVGVGMVTVVVGAIAIVSLSSLRNTQYSKNQIQATKLAQENMELVRSIKNSNFGVCLHSDILQTPPGTCSTWEDVWGITFGSYLTTPAPPHCSTVDCTFTIIYGCTARISSGTEIKPICLSYNANPVSGGSNLSNLTSNITIEDEALGQKKVTSKAYWSDSTGEHSSNLVTVLSKY